MNALLQMLPRHEQATLAERCFAMALVNGDEIHRAGEAVADVLFPTSGYVSLVTASQSAPGLEVGMIGVEGMLGTQLLLGVATAPLRAVVQGAGSALRLPAAALREALAASPVLDRILKGYLHVRMSQFAATAACMRFHAIGQRLARWLLTMQDRSGQPTFRATHEFLAFALGVRRAGVTEAAGELQLRGLIRYGRGWVEVLDRRGLEREACGCYEQDGVIYTQVMAQAAG
jgi:CRP-like cAMP-binding protein